MGIAEATDDGQQPNRLTARLAAMKVATDQAAQRVAELRLELAAQEERAAALASQYAAATTPSA